MVGGKDAASFFCMRTPGFLSPFVEENILFPMCGLGTLSKFLSLEAYKELEVDMCLDKYSILCFFQREF